MDDPVRSGSLILVRHAMPEASPDSPPHEWPLGAAGRAAARVLAAELPAGGYLVASEEPKAWQTLAPAGEVVRDPRFNEVGRVESWGGEFRRLRRSYVDGADHPGWEPRSRVADRFGAAVTDHLAAAGGRPLVVATHGMAMTVWLDRRGELADPGEFWAALRFPDVRRVARPG